jgi:hypothetical protein
VLDLLSDGEEKHERGDGGAGKCAVLLLFGVTGFRGLRRGRRRQGGRGEASGAADTESRDTQLCRQRKNGLFPALARNCVLAGED